MVYTGASKIINPTSGGNLVIKGDITDSSGQPITWTLTMPDGNVRTGTGKSVNETWDGKDANGKVVEPGRQFTWHTPSCPAANKCCVSNM